MAGTRHRCTRHLQAEAHTGPRQDGRPACASGAGRGAACTSRREVVHAKPRSKYCRSPLEHHGSSIQHHVAPENHLVSCIKHHVGDPNYHVSCPNTMCVVHAGFVGSAQHSVSCFQGHVRHAKYHASTPTPCTVDAIPRKSRTPPCRLHQAHHAKYHVSPPTPCKL